VNAAKLLMDGSERRAVVGDPVVARRIVRGESRQGVILFSVATVGDRRDPFRESADTMIIHILSAGGAIADGAQNEIAAVSLPLR
jgi:hypothetical protein